MVNSTDMDGSFQPSRSPYGGATSSSTGKRLHRTRQHLGTYRHDLLVAMRVVNNVEEAMIRAEWQNFLLDETTRCKQVQSLLEAGNQTQAPAGTESSYGDKQQKPLNDEQREESRITILKNWHDEYCGGCMMEQERLLNGKSQLLFRHS